MAQYNSATAPTSGAPPTYNVPIPGSHATSFDAAGQPTKQIDSDSLSFKSYYEGAGVPALQYNHYNNNDLEPGSNGKRRGCKMYSSLVNRTGRPMAIVLLGSIVLVSLAALGGIIFGIVVGAERGLTGENFWSPGHETLFRICESDSTSSKPFQLHTCNVFRPNHDLEAPPLHSFVENVRQWGTGTARRIDPVPLDTLLLNYGLKCSVPEGVTPPPNTQDVQLVVGGVGTGTGDNKKAIACNYLGDGSLKQDSCARYTDGGLRAAGKTHPLGINAMMRKHFGMTCEWVA